MVAMPEEIRFDTIVPDSGFALTEIVSVYRSSPVFADLQAIKCEMSMLHDEVIALLYHFGRFVKAGVLEIGPFIGGSTVAAARGMVDVGTQRPFVTVERGGARMDHPHFQTPDIIASLQRNLKNYGVDALVQVVSGGSRDEPVIEAIGQAFSSAQIDLFICDADGLVLDDIKIYSDLFADDCVLVVDDYYTPHAGKKQNFTRDALQGLVKQGYLEAYGVFGWGTWIGRRTGKALPAM